MQERANGLYSVLIYRLIACILIWIACRSEKRKGEILSYAELDPLAAFSVPWRCEGAFEFLDLVCPFQDH